MAWFRRRPPAPAPSEAAAPDGPTHDDATAVVAATTDALARTARALEVLAVRSNHLHDRLVALEARVDGMAADRAEPVATVVEVPTPIVDEGLRREVTRVGAELSRLQVNLHAQLGAVRDDVAALRGEAQPEIDLRTLTPVDTGWVRPRAS